MFKRLRIKLLLIIVILGNCGAQECTTLADREHISCRELSKAGEDTENKSEYYILYQYDENYVDSSYCTEVESGDYSPGRIETKFINATNGSINCISILIKFRCTDCEHKKRCITIGEADCIETCTCECEVKCFHNQETRIRTITTLVINETLLQPPTTTRNPINITLPTYSISTNTTYPAIETNATTQQPRHNTTQIVNSTSSTVPMSIQIPTKLPFNVSQYILYGAPVVSILIIELTAFLVSLCIYAWYRKLRRKPQDPEAINMNEQLVEGNQMTRETENDTVYTTIPELVIANSFNEITVIPNRLTYTECLEVEQVSSSEHIIQNELDSLGDVDESEGKNRTNYHIDTSSNFYHVLVAGEVVESSLYDKILEDNPLYFSRRASNLALANNSTAIGDRYIEPPSNLPELKDMLYTCLCPHEISERDIEIGEEFASGHFGMVYRGNYHTEKGDIPVAIKTLKETAVTDKDMRVDFMREAAILAQFHHPNVLRLIGILTNDHQPWMMVTELLKTELRQLLIDIKRSPSAPDKLQLQNILLKFSREIAAGMQHLARKKFVHRDLAARNVLVGKDLSVRVADFGMSREIDSENDYYTSSGGRVPLRWTAPEAVFYKKFSESSDVWSFGMTLYEIWSLGDKPWHDYNADEIIEALSTGQTLSQPANCPTQVYQVMLSTWQQEKDFRPSFNLLKKELNSIKFH